MCKYCEKQNREVINDVPDGLLYIMNNIGMAPQLVYSSGDHTKINYCLISYCPFCGARLIDYENLYTLKQDKKEN